MTYDLDMDAHSIEESFFSPESYAQDGCELEHISATDLKLYTKQLYAAEMLPEDSFYKRYVVSQKPVIVVDEPGCVAAAAAAADNEGPWSDRGLEKLAGGRGVVAANSLKANPEFFPGPMHPLKEERREQQMPLRRFLKSKRKGKLYLQSSVVPELEELLPRDLRFTERRMVRPALVWADPQERCQAI